MQSRVAIEPLLVLPGRARAELVRIVEQGYPFEVCGLLEGRRSDAAVEVVRVVAAGNLAKGDRHRYELAPADWFRADAAARAAGRELVGVWHSHPDAPAVPSDADRTAAWPEYSYVIASVRAARVRDLRCWQLSGGAFVEQAVVEAAP